MDTIKKFLLIFAILLVTTNSFVFGQEKNDYNFSKEIQQKLDSEKNSWNIQNYAILFSKIGNYKASIAAQHLYIEKNRAAMNIPEPPKPDSVYFSSFKPENAVDVIAKAAKNYKVVITNEAHYQPENRVFTNLLLDTLYKEGFRYFCVEDLTQDDTVLKFKEDKDLNKRKYPLKTSGDYMDEPQYADLVRHALKIGYKVVPYEYYAMDVKGPMERMQAREKGQAENIAHILQEDPTAKILVHCGYGHLNENIIRDSIGMMASKLKLYYNIDPLTIDQQDMLEENSNPYYRFANVKEPSVFVSGNKLFSDSTKSHKVDMVVFFPRTKYINGRPNWLVFDKRREYYFVKTGRNKMVYPIMILAFPKGEDTSVAVPADIVEIEKPKDKVALVLLPGQYILEIKDIEGKIIRQTVEVK